MILLSRVLKPRQKYLVATLQCNNFSTITSNSSIIKDINHSWNGKYYDKSLEESLYKWWSESCYFEPNMKCVKPSYTIPMPPPNVTGSLHMGHALFVTIQDIYARQRRMSGYNVLWLPGTDHAGIATQMVVEKQLAKLKKPSRLEMGREEFVKEVWKFKHETGDYITKQMKLIGASADWSKHVFTLDSHISHAVTEAFTRLHNKGLIYRANYMIHWSPKLQTAISDLEVDYCEENGHMYTFKYHIMDPTTHGRSSEYIPIATTRPETILGDTAICVHPNDERYAKYIGSKCLVPFQNRPIPVVADSCVEMQFGTGALKVTPGHDAVDYDIGIRHNVPIVNIMNMDCTINHHGLVKDSKGNVLCNYQGMDRFDCRKRIWSDMEAAGLCISKTPHTQRIPRSQRSGEIVEAMVSTQWFVNVKDMAERASNAVRSKEMKLIPERYEKVWYQWLDKNNIHDWCISRQLWWGHRIPVYYVMAPAAAAQPTPNNSEPPTHPIDKVEKLVRTNDYVVASSMEEAIVLAKDKFRSKYSTIQLEQEDDVLDTWFSSGLWPFAPLGWPFNESQTGNQDSKDTYDRFYPTSLLETGHDIVFFWVARMAMLGLELTGRVPFDTVFLHGLVRDAEGQKMSKTKGNVIDPLDVVNKYGSDVLRYGIVTTSSPEYDISLSMSTFEQTKTLVTKMWNIGKYIDHMFSTVPVEVQQTCFQALSAPYVLSRNHSVADHMIIYKLHNLSVQLTHNMSNYQQIAECGKQIADFMWAEFADWYVEISKLQLMRYDKDINPVTETQRVITYVTVLYVYKTLLQLLHPYMPYITETLWQCKPQAVRGADQGSIMISQWPGSRVDEHGNVISLTLEDLNLYEELEAGNQEGSAEYKSSTCVEMDYQCFQSVVRCIRAIRSEYKLDMSKKLSGVKIAIASGGDDNNAEVSDMSTNKGRLVRMLTLEKDVIEGLAKTQCIQLLVNESKNNSMMVELQKTHAQAVASHGVTIYVPLDQLKPDPNDPKVIANKNKEHSKLRNQKDILVKKIRSFEEQLQPTHGFMLNANKKKIDSHKQLLERCKVELNAIEKALLEM